MSSTEPDASTVHLARWRSLHPRRRQPQAAWSLAKHCELWTTDEDALLRSMWSCPHQFTMQEIAARLQRSIASVRIRASFIGLGWRDGRPKQPRKRPYTPGALHVPRAAEIAPATAPASKPARVISPKPPAAVAVDRKPVALKPVVDGVVLTPRLESAWLWVEAGCPVEVVAAELRLPAVEVMALRRWTAKP